MIQNDMIIICYMLRLIDNIRCSIETQLQQLCCLTFHTLRRQIQLSVMILIEFPETQQKKALHIITDPISNVNHFMVQLSKQQQQQVKCKVRN